MPTVREQRIAEILERLRAGSYTGQERADVELLLVEVRRLEELARELARLRDDRTGAGTPAWVEPRLRELLARPREDDLSL